MNMINDPRLDTFNARMELYKRAARERSNRGISTRSAWAPFKRKRSKDEFRTLWDIGESKQALSEGLAVDNVRVRRHGALWLTESRHLSGWAIEGSFERYALAQGLALQFIDGRRRVSSAIQSFVGLRVAGRHGSTYARAERDDYPTPPWVILNCLAPHVELRGKTMWECACGKDGRMAESLKAAGAARVYASDIANGYAGQNSVFDFLSEDLPPGLGRCDLVVTNPPFGKRGKAAESFIERGLRLLETGFTDCVALLLPHDFDSAKTRAHLFGDCRYFRGKITLRRRILWFEPVPDPITGRKNGPKENSGWFLWDRPPHDAPRPPIILYAPVSRIAEVDAADIGPPPARKTRMD